MTMAPTRRQEIDVTDRPPNPSQDSGNWTPLQMAELMRLARQNLSAQKIAMRLGRTEEAVQLKARQNGLVLSEGSPKDR